jgi:peptide/nickel transport system substrate-binding protein
MRNGAAALLLALLALPARAQVANPDTFTYAITGDVDSLDPHWQFDAVTAAVLLHVYEPLVSYRGSSVDEFEPVLASQVPTVENGQLSRDGLRYAFPLRKGVRFHDGTELTAEDARYSLIRFLLTDRASGPSHLLLEPILGVETVRGADGRPDPKLYDLAARRVRVEGSALVLELARPYPPLLSVLAGFGHVVSKKWALANGAWDGRLETWAAHFDPPRDQPLHDKENGTGPFRVERWDRQSRQVVLARFDGYWRAPAKLKRAIFRTVDEPGTRALMLQAGDADAVMAERPHLGRLQGLPGVTVLDDLPMLEAHNVFVMGFKVDPAGNPFVGSGRLDGDGIPPDFFADLETRQAFSHAFDYDGYIRDGFRGKAERARGPIPRGVFGYNPRQAGYPYDLARAADLLRKVRLGEVWQKGFRFTLTYVEGSTDRLLACQILKKNIESLNPKFRVDVRGVPLSTWLASWAAGKVPMANVRWLLDYPDAHDAVFPFLHSRGYYAKGQGYANPRADRFIEQAKREGDVDQRRRIYFELQSLANTDAAQIYTVDTVHFQVLRSWVKGWTHNPIAPYGNLYGVSKAQP